MKKTIWLIIVILIISGIAIGIIISLNLSPKLKEISPIVPEIKKQSEKKITVGYGWSVKTDSVKAIDEAIKGVKSKFLNKSPEYAILFSNANYDSQKIISEIYKTWPEIKVYGGTSFEAVMDKDGFHKGGLTLMGISSKKIDFGVGGADIEKLGAKEAGRQAILKAIENAGKKGILPKIVLITGSAGKEEEVLSGIESIIGNKIPIVGGSAGDNDLSGKWQEFANQKIFKNGVSLTAVYTNLSIGWAYEAGFKKTFNKGVITKASGRTIYEINGQPAAEVYNKWTNGLISKELKTGGPIFQKTALYPLAEIIPGKGGVVRYLSIHPLSVNVKKANLGENKIYNESLSVFANVKKGEKIMLMQGSWELLLDRCQSTPANALILGGIEKDQAYFGIYTYCAGTMNAVPKEQRLKMPVMVQNAIGQSVPFVGTFTFGEQGLIEGVGNKHGNLVNSMVIFGPAKK